MNFSEPHRWFAWHPVLVIDRRADKPNVHFAFLRFVMRRAVSANGAVVFAHEITQ